MANSLMNKSIDCQSPFAGFPLKPIKQLRGTGEVDLGTLASDHGGEKKKLSRSAAEATGTGLLDRKMQIGHWPMGQRRVDQ